MMIQKCLIDLKEKEISKELLKIHIKIVII